MDANAESDLTVLGERLVGRLEFLLNCNGGFHSSHYAWELRENAVARRVGNSAPMLADEPIHDLAMRREDPKRPNLVGVHQARVALYVCGEDGREASLNLW